MDIKHSLSDFMNTYVIETDPQAETTSTSNPTPPPATVAAYKNPQPVDITQTHAEVMRDVDQAALAHLRQRVTTTPQYATVARFLTSVNSLTEFITDERQRFRAAEKHLLSDGVTIQAVEAGLADMLSILSTEVGKFSIEVSAETAKEIDARQKTVDDLTASIAMLKAKIETCTAERMGVADEINRHKQVILRATTGFNAAVDVLRTENEELRRKLNLYLRTTSNQSKENNA